MPPLKSYSVTDPREHLSIRPQRRPLVHLSSETVPKVATVGRARRPPAFIAVRLLRRGLLQVDVVHRLLLLLQLRLLDHRPVRHGRPGRR